MLIDTFISAYDTIMLSCVETEPGFQSPLDPSALPPAMQRCLKAGMKITVKAVPYLRQVRVPDPAFVFQRGEKSLQNWYL